MPKMSESHGRFWREKWGRNSLFEWKTPP